MSVSHITALTNGQFVESRTSDRHVVVTPAMQAVPARVPRTTREEVGAAVANTRKVERAIEAGISPGVLNVGHDTPGQRRGVEPREIQDQLALTRIR